MSLLPCGQIPYMLYPNTILVILCLGCKTAVIQKYTYSLSETICLIVSILRRMTVLVKELTKNMKACFNRVGIAL
jgi:hypothetical protein